MLEWIIGQLATELLMRILLDWLGYQLLMVLFMCKLERLPFNAAELPDKPGIYIAASWFHVAYVGKAASFKRRWRNHHISKKIRFPWFLSFYLLPEESEKRRDRLEQLLIWCLKPKLNTIRFKKAQTVTSRTKLLWAVLTY